MSIQSDIEDLLELAGEADAAVTTVRNILTQIEAKEHAIRDALAGGGDGLSNAGQYGLRNYVVARMQRSVLSGKTVTELATSAWSAYI